MVVSQISYTHNFSSQSNLHSKPIVLISKNKLKNLIVLFNLEMEISEC